ncbi:MAG: hypothetical protein HZA58_01190 [Acidimicrobiia bacterium]|nr:hypothetical protein [Acidimicrobiia bacterium]
MRIALNAVGEVGTRTGLVLLAERSLAALGIYGGGHLGSDRRAIRITGLAGYDVFVTDDPESAPLAAIAVEDGLSCVVTTSVPAAIAGRFAAAGLTLLTNADVRGLAATLAAHETAGLEGVVRVAAAWTVPGKALRRGVGVGLPDPVGARWGRTVEGGTEVPIAGTWAGAAVTVSGTLGGRPTERLIGVADQRDHLEALALAAGAIAVASGSYGPGVHVPSDDAAAYLGAALGAGLGVAAYTA